MKPNGLVLGVLGGMGPAATAEFLSLLSKKAPAKCDQEHPRVIVYSDTIIPNRTNFILGKGENPTPYLLDGLNRLLEWGADILCITCNTSHYYIDSFPETIRSRLISIVNETLEKSKGVSPQGAWLTATLGSMKSSIYQNLAVSKGYSLKIPNENMMIKIHRVTDLVKGGNIKEAGLSYKEICESLWEKYDLPIIGACTELPIAYSESGLPIEKFVSSLESLAEACIRELYK